MKRRKLAIGLAVLILLVAWPLRGTASPVEEEDIEQAILDGLLWLVDQQNLVESSPDYGSWESSSWKIAPTAFAVLKLETYAVETGQLNEEGKIDQVMIGETDYYPNLVAGLEYLMANAATMDLDDPDANEDGKAIYFSGGIYDTSIAMMAIAASTHPEWTATINMVVMTYEDILQDAVDYLVYAQNVGEDKGAHRGGWGYQLYTAGYFMSDQSNSGYAVLGLAYAQASPPYGFELEIPETTKDELNFWIEWAQCDDGGSKYYPGYAGCYWENTLKTGNLLFEMALVGDTKDTPRVQDAISYIEAHWYDLNLITGWGWNDPTGPSIAQYQAAYCLMKGLESMNIELDEMDGIDNWYLDLADVIVPQQTDDGYWRSSPCYVWPHGSYGTMSGTVLSTEWALLTLEKAAPPVGVIPVFIDIKPGSCPNPLNPKSKGVLTVAVLGTEGFDVTTIDPASILLSLEGIVGGVEPIRWSDEDVATPFEGELCDCHDLDGDGYMDLILKFDTQDLVETLGLGGYAGETIHLTLTGNLKAEGDDVGPPIQGSDCVRIK